MKGKLMRLIAYILLLVIVCLIGVWGFQFYGNSEQSQAQEIIQQQDLLDLDASALE